MTGVVERNLSQSQILKDIQDKNTVVPKDFLTIFRDEIMGYKGYHDDEVRNKISHISAVRFR